MFFFFNDTATTVIYTYCHTLSLHDALPIYILLDGLADAVEAGDAVPLGIFEAAVVVVLEDLAVAVTLGARGCEAEIGDLGAARRGAAFGRGTRSEEHTSELQSLMRISYAVFCLKKKINVLISARDIYLSTILTIYT